MKLLWLPLLLALAFAGFGCDEDAPPKLKPKVAKKVEAPEPPKEDPLKAAKENADSVATSAAVYFSDRTREIASEIEASSSKTKSSRTSTTSKKSEPLTGSIPKAALRKVFNAHSGAMRKCYERELKRNPGLQGKVRLEVVIQKNGKVGKASAHAVSLRNGQVHNCMERQARTMSFPQPTGGAAVVAIPYTFTPDL